jgi:DNA sulfur modification protein DndB
MSFLNENQIHELKSSMSSDPSLLGKIYKAKKDKYQRRSVDHSLVDGFIAEGWEEEPSTMKTKARIRKLKLHSTIFEDDVWCQYYELGFRQLNIDENFRLPFSRLDEDKKQIDIVAVKEDTVILVECKSSESRKNAPSFREDFDALNKRMEGYLKALKQLFGEDKRAKFIFATRNLRMNKEGEDLKRLKNVNGFYFNENTYEYVNNLITKYKKAALYQFQGLIFRNQLINSNSIEVPALKGFMGDKEYYVFSLEPVTLLKLGFVLHRRPAPCVWIR